MKTVLSIAAVLGAAGASQAAFEAAAVDFGSAAGSAIVASAAYVQSAQQDGADDLGFTGAYNDIAPFGGADSGAEFGSGLWMSGTGIDVSVTEVVAGVVNSNNVMGRTPGLAANASGGPDIIIGNTLAGGWLVSPNEASGDNGLGGEGSVLLARLSVPAGETIDFANAVGSVTLNNGGSNFTFEATINGANVAAGGSVFQLVAVALGTQDLEGTAVDTWDIFVNEVPTPGAVALAGIAGLAGVRRRR